MQTFTLPARPIPLDTSYDVIVLGGGPSGCTAAAAAAREGAKTLLIESTGSLGGMGTSALVPAWCPFSDKEQIIYRGLAEKVFRASQATTPHEPKDKLDWVAINPEALKIIYDDLVTSHGADVRFLTQFVSVEPAVDGKVSTIITASKAGLAAYSAKVFIDCTGDADLAAFAGAPFHSGHDNGEALMPVTHCFILANVDEYGYRTTIGKGGNLNPVIASGKYPLISDHHFCNNLVGPGCVGFNAGHQWEVDNTDPASVSRAMIHGRKMVRAYRDGLAEFYPTAFANSFVVQTGSLMGIRETRRIIGDYVLTLEDYLARRSFDDEICRNSYFIDVHLAKDQAAKQKTGEYNHSDWEKTTFSYKKGESHGIPYRCLLPQKLSNVLVAGRSISCDKPVQGSVRVMPVCLAMGEAAGLAAALAAQQPTPNVRAIDTADLRTRRRTYGAYLP